MIRHLGWGMVTLGLVLGAMTSHARAGALGTEGVADWAGIAPNGANENAWWMARREAPVYATRAGIGVPCDLNGDGFCLCDDIDAMTAVVAGGGGDDRFDLNGDGRVDVGDREVLILDLFDTTYGDVNLDGRFDPQDFVHVFTAGGYGQTPTRLISYCDGDWNGDGIFDSGDLVFVFQHGGYIPEPSGMPLLLSASWVILALRNGRPKFAKLPSMSKWQDS